MSQSGPGSDDHDGVFHIPQISKAGALPSNDLILHLDDSLWGSYPSAEMQSAYSSTPDD